MAEENEQPTPIDPLTRGELITLSEAAQLSGFTVGFLSELALNEKLRAKRSGRYWLTTMAAIEEYKKKRSLKNIPKKYRDKT